MRSAAKTVVEYLGELAPDRREIVSHVRDAVNTSLPDGYEETMNFGMITTKLQKPRPSANCSTALSLPRVAIMQCYRLCSRTPTASAGSNATLEGMTISQNQSRQVCPTSS